MKNIDIKDFNQLEVKIDYDSIMDKYSKKAKNILVVESPKSNRPNRATPYSQGWTVNKRLTKKGSERVIWNETNWQLTHLLENGHFVTNVSRHIVWVRPRKHIKQTYLSVKNGYIRAMQKAKIKADLK